MATRSNIGIRENDGTISTIYCHNDGYPQHVGRILLADYTSETAVRELLALGDISTLGDTTLSTYAYHRDRGEAKADPIVYEPGAFEQEHDYAYVWDIAGERWLWWDENALKPLTQEDVVMF
jgi:hypothetical protein